MRTLALVFVSLLFSTLAYAKPADVPASVLGEWRGRYICSQGVTALKLTVSRKPDGKVAARFDFGPVPENPTVPTGSYLMAGVFDAKTRRLNLRGVKWLDDRSGYMMVDLDGHVSKSGDAYTGRVPDFPGCTIFDLRRAEPLTS